MPPQARDPEERFWEKVDKNGPIPAHRPKLGPCWVWLAAAQRNGYGRFSPAKDDSRLTHRYSFSLVSELADAEELDHVCRNRACVRPSHLEIVTHRENMLRGDTIAARNASRTHCPQGHPYQGVNLYLTPRGDRQCRTCRRAACSKSYFRKKAAA